MVERLPPMFIIPLDGIDVSEGIQIRQDVRKVERLAAKCSTAIADASKPMNSLIKAYLKSPSCGLASGGMCNAKTRANGESKG